MFNKHIFKVPSALQIASRDLENTKRDLLAAQAAAEHSAKMVEYYKGVVARLSSYIQEESQAS